MLCKSTCLTNKGELQSKKLCFSKDLWPDVSAKRLYKIRGLDHPTTSVERGSVSHGLPARKSYHLHRVRKIKQIKLRVAMPLKRQMLLPLNPTQLLHFLKCLMQIKMRSFFILFTPLPLADSHFWQRYQVNFGKRNLKVVFFKIISVYFTSEQEF